MPSTAALATSLEDKHRTVNRAAQIGNGCCVNATLSLSQASAQRTWNPMRSL